jgi:CelD/BcsL family acetyltransferase involved in cellulose biosynthesis
MDFSTFTQFPDDKKSEWNAFVTSGVSHVPFLRYDYLKNWWRTRGGGEWSEDAQLVIVTASENGRLLGIAPCFVAEHEGKKALLFLGTIEISDYLDFMVKPQHLVKFTEGFLGYARTTLAPQYGIEVVDLYNIVDQSPTVRALKNGALSLGMDCEITPLVQSPYIPLSGDWEGYLNSLDKKQRHEIRRKMRRLTEAEVKSEWYIAEDAEKIDSEIQEFLRLMAFDDEKKNFLTPAMKDQMASSMREAFDSGSLQLAFITIGEEKAAAYLNFDFLNRIWVYNSGIDPRFSEFSPGWVLLSHLLKWANENNRFEFDFMRGNEDYKYRFGAIDRAVVRAKITL